MKLPAHEYLDRLGLPYETATFPASTEKGAANVAHTLYEVSSVPPFHWQPEGFRSFCDAALMREERLGVGAGVWGQEILLTPDTLVKTSRARVVNLTERDRPLTDEAAPY